MQGFRQFLNEGRLSDVLQNDQPTFILIVGGSASGKNFVHKKNFSHVPLVDVDEITKDLSGGDFEKARKLVSKAVAVANKELDKYFSSQRSVAQVTTGSNETGVVNKLKKAKSQGLRTALILVDVPAAVAVKRNQERAAKGEQGLIPDWKVEKTNEAARATYKAVSAMRDLVDFSTVINN